MTFLYEFKTGASLTPHAVGGCSRSQQEAFFLGREGLGMASGLHVGLSFLVHIFRADEA